MKGIDRVTYPVLQISPKKLLVYGATEYFKGDRRITLNYKRHDITTERTYSGEMSKAAKKRVMRAVSYMHATSKKQKFWDNKTEKHYYMRLNFITLTLSADIERSKEKKFMAEVFRPFLRHLKKQFGVNSYIWKAERQEVSENNNGRLHWHLTTNKFIPWQELRDNWNRFQERHGIITKFQEQHNHRNPNSTDIHAVYKVRDIEAYIAKYISKETEGDKIQGKVWDCSKNLKGIKPVERLLCDEALQLWDEAKKVKGSRLIKAEHCDIILLDEVEHRKLMFRHKIKEYNEHLKLIEQ